MIPGLSEQDPMTFDQRSRANEIRMVGVANG